MSKVDCNRPINGILLLNKPQGLSSNAVLQRVKRLFKAKKAGHTGSLDPLATGMLPICFGEATKFCQYLLDADKSYEATGLLGIKTTTGDSTGEISEEVSQVECSESDLLAVLEHFKGPTKQIPSMFSALKHKGIPLYKYAREGLSIEREARQITIQALELTAFCGREFDIRVSCSKGTYIRNLVEDIGEQLAVGAHVTRLHRLHTAGFCEEKMYGLDELEKMTAAQLLTCLLPMERAVNYLPVIKLTADEILDLRQGKILHNKLMKEQGCLRLHDEEAQLIGLGDLDASGNLQVKRLLTEQAVLSERV